MKKLLTRQAALLRRHAALLRQEFQAVLGPIEGDALQAATQSLQSLPFEALLARAQTLLSGINERTADWPAHKGLMADVHARLAPVLTGELLERLHSPAQVGVRNPGADGVKNDSAA